ncbi:hypothetical protein [Streptomyces geranii]|uniref:hypothetical protein n=1 Tax=Streptomyces geranii TaxID=2058923 RepID=UPI000D042079|nr:hypothetical protein [Streptomyces geranii]
MSGLAANPALPSELVDRLIEVAVADVDFVDDLAERADLSREQALALFARVPDSGVRLAGAGRLIAADVDPVAEPDTALALLDEGRGQPEWARVLVADPCFLRRERLAACKGLPLDVAETLAADPDVRVVDELALCTTSPEIAARLAAHPHAQVRRALAWNEAVPPAVLLALLAGEGHDDPPPDTDTSVDDPYEITVLHIQHAALRNPSTPTEAAVAFADHPSPMLRQALAQRPDLPPELGRRLAADPVPCVRADLAENPATTDDALMLVLAEDEDPDVRRHLAHNPNVPLDLLTRLVATTKIGAVLLPRIATATPAESEELARSRDSTVRMLLAVRRDLPAGIRDALATDPDAKVLKTIAPHPGLSEARLRAMVDRHGVRVLAKVASNPGASGALLEDLTRHRPPVHKAFREIARHPHATPQALLACLAVTDGRSAAAGHPALLPEAVVELLADEDHQVARAAASNPALPRTVMRQLIRRLMP